MMVIIRLAENVDLLVYITNDNNPNYVGPETLKKYIFVHVFYLYNHSAAPCRVCVVRNRNNSAWITNWTAAAKSPPPFTTVCYPTPKCQSSTWNPSGLIPITTSSTPARTPKNPASTTVASMRVFNRSKTIWKSFITRARESPAVSALQRQRTAVANRRPSPSMTTN